MKKILSITLILSLLFATACSDQSAKSVRAMNLHRD